MAVVEDGTATHLIEEERLSRVKGAPSALPLRALDAILHAESGRFQHVDAVAVSWDPDLDPFTSRLGRAADELIHTLDGRGITHSRIKFIPHHASHAVAAAAYSDRGPAATVIVADGRGEASATSVYQVDGAQATLIKASPIHSSLGHFYAAATEVCGFGLGGQGRTMGLAPYGNPRWRFDDLAVEDLQVLLFGAMGGLAEQDGSARQAWVQHFRRLVACELIAPDRQLPFGIDGRLADLAASVQATLDRALCDLVANVAAAYPTTPLLLCGGVALNCTTNRHLRDRGQAVGLSPVPHDAGAALGAALIVASELGALQLPIRSPYLGFGWSDAELRSVLSTADIAFDQPTDIVAATAQLLHDRQVVGWFQGRSEVGPRALGHRSIIARADSVSIRDRINRDIKRREPWRPFGPSIIGTAASTLIDVPVSRFMVERAMPITPEALSGVTHVDGMTRPHLVDRDWVFRSASKTCCPRSNAVGVSAVLNTSFNVDREPIVCTPNDALETFRDRLWMRWCWVHSSLWR